MTLLAMERPLVLCNVPDFFFNLNKFRSLELFSYVSHITFHVTCPVKDVLMHVNKWKEKEGIWFLFRPSQRT